MTVLTSLIALGGFSIAATPQIVSYATKIRRKQNGHSDRTVVVDRSNWIHQGEKSLGDVLNRTRNTQRTPDKKKWSTFEVVQLVRESPIDVSVYMMPLDGQAPPSYRPGQHTMIYCPAMGKHPAAQRCYTLSLAPGLGVWRITVRDSQAPSNANSVSRWVCNGLQVGDHVSVRKPGGVFTLDLADDAKPLVLIGAGIGITPMASMIQAELMFDRKRPKWLIHQVRDESASPLTEEVCEIVEKSKHAKAMIAYSQSMPASALPFQNTTRVSGRLDGDAITRWIGTTDASFFLCGPEPWTEAITNSLIKSGVPANQIFSEGFGGPQSSHSKAEPTNANGGGNASAEATIKHQVEFSLTGKSIGFTTNDSDLLSHAETHSVPVTSGCRSGSCGTCAVRLLKGKVKYKKPPQCEIAEDEILPCICEPAEDISIHA